MKASAKALGPGGGWQYALADLSLILFMVCALALAQAPKPGLPQAAPAAPPRPPVQAVALGEPAAVWRAGPGSPSLAEWIAGQAADPRQRLTIVAHYTAGRASDAFVRAETALQGVRKLPASARIVVEPGSGDDLAATLTWDLGGG